MTRNTLCCSVLLGLLCGCSSLPPSDGEHVVQKQTAAVSSDDPFIELQDGSQISVDGLLAGESCSVSCFQSSDKDRTVVEDWDFEQPVRKTIP